MVLSALPLTHSIGLPLFPSPFLTLPLSLPFFLRSLLFSLPSSSDHNKSPSSDGGAKSHERGEIEHEVTHSTSLTAIMEEGLIGTKLSVSYKSLIHLTKYHTVKIIVVCLPNPSISNRRSAETIWPRDVRGYISWWQWALVARTGQFLCSHGTNYRHKH